MAFFTFAITMPLAFAYALASVAFVSALSLIGVVTIAVSKERLSRMVFFLVALASGALLGDSFIHLIPEAFETLGAQHSSLLALAGIAAFFALEKIFRWHHGHHEEDSLGGENRHHPEARRTASLGRLILVSDGVHNFIDGIILAGSFLVSVPVGIATALAVVLHEIPQEIGDFGVLLHAGYSRGEALFFNFLSALTAFAGVFAAFLIGAGIERFSQAMIPFAAGSFLYIATSDLLPEIKEHRSVGSSLVELLGLGIGVGAMYLLLFLE